MSAPNYAVIGGTGFDSLPPEIFAEPIQVETPFGNVSLWSLSDNYVEPHKLYFLPRHGSNHSTPPHQINFRANFSALHALEVGTILATNAVGSLRTDWHEGTLALLTDFLDFTHQRPLTYFTENQWAHTDFTEPYSPRLRSAILKTAQAHGIPIHPTAVYICTEGPRFETPAEVRLFHAWGADVVGMTGVPEVVFARELGMEYAALALVTNLAAGLKEGSIVHQEHHDISANYAPLIRELFLESLSELIFDKK